MAIRKRVIFDDDHEAFRGTVRRFLAAEVVPHLDKWRAAGQVPRELFLAAGENGFLGTAAPEELGGGGTDDLRFTAVLVEETAAVGATGLALTFAVHAGVCLPVVLEHGTEAQREAWVPGLASGGHIGVTAAIGSPVQTRAVEDGLALDVAVPGVSGGTYAGLIMLGVVHDDESGLLLVPPGASLVSSELVVDSLAARDAGQADLAIRGTVDSACFVRPGLSTARRDLDLWSAVLGVAAADAVLGLTIDYVRERKVFGRPLTEFENTRHRLAALASGIASAQLFVDECLRLRADDALTYEQAAMARLSAQAIHDDAVDQGMQLHGGYGYMREYPISHAFADARYLRNAGRTGSDALEVVALGLGI